MAKLSTVELDALVEQTFVDAYDEHEQLTAFRMTTLTSTSPIRGTQRMPRAFLDPGRWTRVSRRHDEGRT